MDNEKSKPETGFETATKDTANGGRGRPAAGGGFVKQAAILGGASLFVRLLGFFYRVPLTNLIGDEGNAYYNSAYQIYAFAANLTSFFMMAAVSRLISERIALAQYRNAHTLFKTAVMFSLAIGTVGSLVMFFGADAIITVFNLRPGAIYALRAVAPSVFILSVLTVLRGYFQGMNTAFPTAASQVVEQIFNVAFSLLLAFLLYDAATGGDVRRAAAGATGGTSIATLAALGVVAVIYLMALRKIKARIAADTTEFRERRRSQLAAIMRTAWPMIIGLSIFSVASLLDIGMANARIPVSGAFTEYEVNVLVGQFTGKFVLLTSLPASLSMALAFAVIPEITAAHVTGDTTAVASKTNQALRLSMMISIPAAVGLAVLADPIIAMLIPRHPDGGSMLRYGAISIVFLAVVHVVTGILQGIGRVRLPVIALLAGLLVKIPLNFFLMSLPSVNMYGAVISTIAFGLVAAGVNLFFLRRHTGVLPDFKNTFAKPALAAAGMGVVSFIVYHVIYMFASNLVATLAAMAVGFVVYVIFMVLIKGFGERELNALPLPGFIKKFMSR